MTQHTRDNAEHRATCAPGVRTLDSEARADLERRLLAVRAREQQLAAETLAVAKAFVPYATCSADRVLDRVMDFTVNVEDMSVDELLSVLGVRS